MNRFEVLGRSGADAEIRYTQGGTPVLELSIADNRKHGDTYVVQWFKVVVYGDRAVQLAPLVKKGVEIWAMGEYERRQSKSRDGTQKYYEQLNASYIRVCSSTSPSAGDEGGI